MAEKTSAPLPLTNRKSLLATLANAQNSTTQTEWDVIVIGGGIVGAGILQEATRRGLRALLVEQKDFAWGTSSRSSKMVHGGLRYIAQGDLKVTKHSLEERERLLKEAPGLIDRMGYYFVIKKRQIPGRFIMSVLLKLYDRLARIKDHKYLNAKETIKKFPELNKDKLKGSCYYTDSVVDDARLVIRVLQESVQAGAQALNYAKVTTLLKDSKTGQVIGVKFSNEADESKQGDILSVKSSVVINATGAWADKLRSEVIDEKRVRPLRGSHLVLAQTSLFVEAAITILHPQDKRPVFIFPWEGVTVIGTTDLDHNKNLNNEATITEPEVNYLLKAVNSSFPNNKITPEKIISTFSGVRPVIASDNDFSKSASKERRDHAVWANNGLITASGGKLTTFRLTAIEALNAANPWFTYQQKNKENKTEFNDAVFSNNSLEQIFKSYHQKNKAKNKWLQRLLGRYGNNAGLILEQTNESENKTILHTSFCLAECRWAIKNEGVVHLDDLLLRRTRLGLLLNNGAKELLDQLFNIFQQELGWDIIKWQDEVKRYNKIWQQFYYLPKSVIKKSS